MIVMVGDSDDETHCQIRRALLAILPCELHRAQNGADLLDKLQERTPHALILDAHLPIADAFEVLPVVRDCPRLAAVPVFVVTTGIAAAEARRLLELDVQDILLKPLSQDRLDRLTGALVKIASSDVPASPLPKRRSSSITRPFVSHPSIPDACAHKVRGGLA